MTTVEIDYDVYKMLVDRVQVEQYYTGRGGSVSQMIKLLIIHEKLI